MTERTIGLIALASREELLRGTPNTLWNLGEHIIISKYKVFYLTD